MTIMSQNPGAEVVIFRGMPGASAHRRSGDIGSCVRCVRCVRCVHLRFTMFDNVPQDA